MKKFLSSLFALLWVLQGFSQRENITLTFRAKDSLTQNFMTGGKHI